MEIKKASKKQLKIKIALNGSSGSGKTAGALLIAYGICNDWEKICVIDAENRSSELYVGMKFGETIVGDFNTIQLAKPYSPERYIEAIDLCLSSSNIEVVIIDSMSHEWDGSGGVLDIHNSMTGNSFTNWAKLTPRHNKFIETIINADKHIIGTFRAKQDYVMQEKNGKQVPEKVGLKAITREGVDYEFTLCFDIDIKHNVQTTKDRTNQFMDKPEFIITKETGEKLKNWAESGEYEKTKTEENKDHLDAICKEAENLKTKEEIAQHWKTNIKFQKEQAYIDAIKQVGAKIQKEEPKGVIENARDFVYNFLNKEENEIFKIEVLKGYKKSSIETLTDTQIQEIKVSINKK